MKTILLTLGIVLLTACAGNQKAEVEATEPTRQTEESKTPNIIGEEITYEADSITMKGYLAYDANRVGPRPGVLVVHEWWGHNEHTRKSAEKLAEAGYVAMALDMYGDGKSADHPKDAMAFSSAVMSDFEGAKKRFEAGMRVLSENEMTAKDDIAAIGYCFGGGIVLNMARQGESLDAVASFHGSIDPIVPATAGGVKARILIMNGADDPFVSDESITALHKEMTDADVDYEFIDYSGAVHAFTNPAATEKGLKFELPLAYNQEADSASWVRMLQFLESTFN
jgi:dienelactone hydrolase